MKYSCQPELFDVENAPSLKIPEAEAQRAAKIFNSPKQAFAKIATLLAVDCQTGQIVDAGQIGDIYEWLDEKALMILRLS